RCSTNCACRRWWCTAPPTRCCSCKWSWPSTNARCASRWATFSEGVSRTSPACCVAAKWIEGVKRHGYKGAFEMAATVDNLFAFDATTALIEP
ncbi:cobaltochelatase subunit CobN, partial [Klebsiella pneumoniae]|uniref:cobaltochelatase subunit CobN n=1 Tax=Klebsiella pneumoniae TaxID=573 RepID=UPI0034DEDB02